jgi:nitronate monooxygenase
MLDLRDPDRPIVAAPMAGGASTPALAAAVTEAGGLGYVAAGYKTAAAVAEDLAAVRAATSGPLALNVFIVERHEPLKEMLDAYRAALEPEATRLGIALGEPRWDDDDREAKLELVLDERPDLVSFTFGCPDAHVLRRLADAGVHTAVTVTTADEAREAVARGTRSLVVQGPDAGAHRGTWDLLAEPSTQPLPELIRDVRAAVDVPVVAGGGVMDAAGVEAVLEAGAVAALCGTAYLLADEAGTNPLHRKALTDPAFEATELTRAYTGRWARGLANRFIAEHRDAPAAYPQLHHLTSLLRKAAVAAGDAQVAHLWAGTGHALARPGPAAEITRSLAP